MLRQAVSFGDSATGWAAQHRPALVPVGGLLVGVADAENGALGEAVADDHEADGEAVGKAAGDGEAG